MKLYFAPMEGITLAPFRNVHQRFFSGIDIYFTPFLAATQTFSFQRREIRDVLPANNKGIRLEPQILTVHADQFLWAVSEMTALGYDRINLNLGCSMPQVARRGKGAGFLADPDRLDRFFCEFFEEKDTHEDSRVRHAKITVKTRIGAYDEAEAVRLLEIYNRYPISELTVHPRLMCEIYKGTVHTEVFDRMYTDSIHPVCYNGDINTKEDYERVTKRWPGLCAVMIGRGFLRHPFLLPQILQAADLAVPGPERKAYIRKYHDALFDTYLGMYTDERQAVAKMKELWYYMGSEYMDRERELKRIRKARSAQEYEAAAEMVFG